MKIILIKDLNLQKIIQSNLPPEEYLVLATPDLEKAIEVYEI